MRDDIKKSLETCNKMIVELKRVEDAINGFKKELEIDNDSNWGISISKNRGLIKHRTIDLKMTITKLVKEL